MIKTFSIIGIIIFLSTPLIASSVTLAGTGSISLLVAIAALAIAIFNVFRINKVRRIHDVDFMNQKEDFALTLERFKTSLTNDSRNFRKEFPRHTNFPKPNTDKQVSNSMAPAAPGSNENLVEVKKQVQKNPNPKKKYYHRRKPSGTSGERNTPPKV
jgi:hypothetical protein